MKNIKLFTFEGQDLVRSFNIDPLTDQRSYSFTLAGRLCASKELTDKYSESLGKYALIDKDLDYIIRTVKLVISLTDDKIDLTSNKHSYQYISKSDDLTIIQRSLFSSAVIAYGKCFASANGRGVKLEKTSVFKNEASNLLEIHANIIDARNDYIAHAGKTFMENFSVHLVSHPDKERDIPAFISVDTDFINHVSRNTFIKYMMVFEHVSAHVKQKMEHLYEKINKEQ